MLKIGHRGAKGYVAENTILSFQKAIELGVDMIELDVHLSKDNIPIVIHDNTIDRTTNGVGLVCEYTSMELQILGIPTLEEIISIAIHKCDVNIEIKEYNAMSSVLELIEKYSEYKKTFLISSFDWNVLREIKQHDPELKIGVLTETDIDLALAFAKFINAHSIHPYYHLLTKENVNQMQSKGFKIYAWTVNESEDSIFVKSLNVDGIITDFPDRI